MRTGALTYMDYWTGRRWKAVAAAANLNLIWANTGVALESCPCLDRLQCGVHDKLHISSADWWDLLLPLAARAPWHRHQIEGTNGF